MNDKEFTEYLSWCDRYPGKYDQRIVVSPGLSWHLRENLMQRNHRWGMDRTHLEDIKRENFPKITKMPEGTNILIDGAHPEKWTKTGGSWVKDGE